MKAPESDYVYYVEDLSVSVRNQYIAATIACMTAFAYGAGIGWVSPVLPLLQSPESPIGTPLTPSQAAAVASLYCVGGLVGSLLAGIVVDKWGRKITGLAIAVPYVTCWVLKLTANNVAMLFAARILAGAGGGASMLQAPMYSLEVGSLHVRGALGSILILALNWGVLFSYVIGAYLSYELVLWLQLAVPVATFVAFIFMPETPTYLVMKGRYEEALKSIAWLRNTTVDDPGCSGVLANLKYEDHLASKSSKIEHALETDIAKKIDSTEAQSTEKEMPDWKFFLTSRASLKAFFMCFVLLTAQSYVGVFAMVSFVSQIFADAGSTLSPDNATIVVGVLQVAGSTLSIFIVEKVGRKVLFIVCCMSEGIGTCTMATYFYFQSQDYNMSSVGWIPVLALSLVVFMDGTGVGPVPYILPNEMFMVQAHGIGFTILSVWTWFTLFTLGQFYNDVETALGSYGVFWLFCGVAVCGSLFCFFVVPETRGKTLEEIVEILDPRLKKKGIENNGFDKNAEIEDEKDL